MWWEVSSQVGVWAKPPQDPHSRVRRPRSPANPVSNTGNSGRVQSGIWRSHTKGWKKIRWREGSKGWLESRFLAVRVQPSPRVVDGEPPHKEVLGYWCNGRKKKGAHQIFLCDLSPSPHRAVWCGQRNRDGRLSRTISHSKTSSGTPTTIRAELGRLASSRRPCA